MKERKYIVYNILWDANDTEKEELPDTMEVTVTDRDMADLNSEEEIGRYIEEYISDETGFCCLEFIFEQLQPA